MKKMLILAFLIVVESRLTGGKYECFDCMLTIERNKTVPLRTYAQVYCESQKTVKNKLPI